jgi:tetratricopeptide (TPR) repeat protein
MVYAYLQQGRDREAAEVVRRTKEAADRYYGAILGYNAIALQARYALEREAWTEAAAQAVPSKAAPFVTAVARFARAIGFARSGNLTSAESEVVALGKLRDTLRSLNDTYWATIVEAQRLAASAWIARGNGDTAGAIRLARQGAELEETVEKHPVTPGPLLPARELEGDLLMELGRYAEALASYEKTLEREPKRARALFGAARAAELAKRTAVARERYAELVEVMAKADPDRKEVRVAREFLGRSD